MNVHIFDHQKDLTISSHNVQEIVKEVLKEEGKLCDEVSIHFIDTEEISSLHAKYFDDPSTTDCISFPLDDSEEEGYLVLGEVFVCPKTAIDYAADHQVSPLEETTLYIVHGLLHLLGYDDIGQSVVAMRHAEKLHMKNLEKHNLILGQKK